MEKAAGDLEKLKGSTLVISSWTRRRRSSPTRSLLAFIPALKQSRDLMLCWWRLVRTDNDLNMVDVGLSLKDMGET